MCVADTASLLVVVEVELWPGGGMCCRVTAAVLVMLLVVVGPEGTLVRGVVAFGNVRIVVVVIVGDGWAWVGSFACRDDVLGSGVSHGWGSVRVGFCTMLA